MDFQTESKQLTSQQKITIRLFKDEDGGDVRIIKRWDFVNQMVLPAMVVMNVHFGHQLDAASAFDAAEWYKIAAQTAASLDRIFQTRDDLKRWVNVRMVSKTVTITFKE